MANIDQNGNSPQVLRVANVRKVYLITYSDADINIFDRKVFANAVLESFDAVTTAKVTQWACCMEQHRAGNKHFHMCVLLDKLQRWLKVKKHLKEHFHIIVNFSGHDGYFTAFNYVIEEDSEFITSENHPDAIARPKTANALKALSSKRRSKKSAKKQKKRLNNLDVAELILKQNVKSRTYLLALARAYKVQGETRLYEFVLNRGDKKVNELIQSVWEMESAREMIDRAAKSRLQILRDELLKACICKGEWLTCALEILAKNGIERAIFSDAIVKLLVMGRGKGRNIFISGPANCGKTFILDPLRVVFNTFLSPASCSYAWLGVEDKEVIFLNDFRYSTVILPWSDMLLLLEGHVVHFAAPKTTYSKDIEFSKDTPIFATSKSPITFVKGSIIDDRETEMMNVRWRMFTFRHQIDLQDQKSVQPCGHCFAKLLLD